MKTVQAPNFKKFRNIFTPKLCKLFIVPANTFDNVKGQFPIGFFIWNCEEKETLVEVKADVFDSNGVNIESKTISSYINDKYVIDWLKNYHDKANPDVKGFLRMCGTDVQHNKDIFICNKLSDNDIKERLFTPITEKNVIQTLIYCCIRHIIPADWKNDRDQFLYPNKNWETDKIFQSNCLTFMLFDDSNVIKSENGENNFIPFTREQVGCKKSFKSNFMSKFLNGQIETSTEISLFENGETKRNDKIVLSKEAQAVYDSGLELWKYYHLQPNANPNAAFYDIKKYFQGETNGRMNNTSADDTYNELISDLRAKMKMLAKKIESKVYEYGFLK